MDRLRFAIEENARIHARSLRGTPEFERSSNARKKVAMCFAHLKVQHGFERMRLRGLTGARDEFHLAATVQNLKTMACVYSARQQTEGARRPRKRHCNPVVVFASPGQRRPARSNWPPSRLTRAACHRFNDDQFLHQLS
jgi:hypothetical protein